MDSFYFINNEDIYEVSVGTDPKSNIRYTVGKQYSTGGGEKVVITAIAIDQNSLIEHGVNRALIYAQNEKGEEILWKVTVDIPLIITCRI